MVLDVSRFPVAIGPNDRLHVLPNGVEIEHPTGAVEYIDGYGDTVPAGQAAQEGPDTEGDSARVSETGA